MVNEHWIFAIVKPLAISSAIGTVLVLAIVSLVPSPSIAQDNVPVPTTRPDKSSPSETKSQTPAAKPSDDGTGNADEQAGPVFDLARTKTCERELRKIRARFEVLRPISGDGPCGAERPLLLKQLPLGIAVPDGVTLRCEVALALSKWTSETVVPSAKLHLDSKLSAIDISTSYQCRRRNHTPNGKFSEHAFANGVDISGFRFEDRDRLPVGIRLGQSEPDRAFQAAVRGASCAYFTTVLGPTTNASHADHFHFDMAERKRGYRLCQ